jgi:hypothetical protein
MTYRMPLQLCISTPSYPELDEAFKKDTIIESIHLSIDSYLGENFSTMGCKKQKRTFKRLIDKVMTLTPPPSNFDYCSDLFFARWHLPRPVVISSLNHIQKEKLSLNLERFFSVLSDFTPKFEFYCNPDFEICQVLGIEESNIEENKIAYKETVYVPGLFDHMLGFQWVFAEK